MGLKDIFGPLAGLEKLKLTAFEDSDYTTEADSFTVLYNPTNFSFDVRTEWIHEEGANPDGKELQFRTVKSDSVNFEFLFDATGASPTGNDSSGILGLGGGAEPTGGDDVEKSAASIIERDKHVDGAIKRFLDVTHHMKSEPHSPHYVQINWGAYEFRGVAENSSINYKLFDSSGLPIRATVTTNFVESISRREQSAAADRKSADLTHRRIVKSGETLPLIANKVYGDPKYYVELAKVNNITNFRTLEPGQEIILPPIEK
jgi:LysM repeat protein